MHLDQGLPRHPKPGSLAIERLDHPDGEIDVDSPLLVARTPRPRQIEKSCDVFAATELIRTRSPR
jgi:hypothetical protein